MFESGKNSWLKMGVLAILFVVPSAVASAQEHEHPAAQPPTPADSTAGPVPDPRAVTAVSDFSRMEASMMGMMPGPLDIPRTREGSGTSWLPDATPMYALHRQSGPWELMLHGNVVLHYIDQGSDRGDEQLGSTNWIMGMARRPVGGGALTARGMLSLDPLTVGECGYPDLLATGEFCDGEPLHDRQHPHDLFMELAAVYERAISDDLAIQLYGGPVGEPALGPVAFPHRISAMPNPLAPISHHWLDSTHIAFGVATAGLYGRRWKAEGSLFNGREPDEERYDFDLDALTSYSGRLSFLPNERWALQVSAGQLDEAEVHEPGGPPIDVKRVTGSAVYHRPLASDGIWSTSLAWGRNTEEDESTNAFLVETNLNLAERNLFYGRAEVAEKSGGDLVLPEELEEETFTTSKLTLGFLRQFAPVAGLVPGVGVGFSVAFLPNDLETAYGTTTPAGFHVTFRLRPAAMTMDGMNAEPHGMEHR